MYNSRQQHGDLQPNVHIRQMCRWKGDNCLQTAWLLFVVKLKGLLKDLNCRKYDDHMWKKWFSEWLSRFLREKQIVLRSSPMENKDYKQVLRVLKLFLPYSFLNPSFFFSSERAFKIPLPLSCPVFVCVLLNLQLRLALGTNGRWDQAGKVLAWPIWPTNVNLSLTPWIIADRQTTVPKAFFKNFNRKILNQARQTDGEFL